MAEFTRRQLAEELGCTKQTIMLYERELELGDHVSTRGQTIVYDEFAASAIAAKAGGRFAVQQERASESPADFLQEILGHYKSEVDRLTNDLDSSQARLHGEIERLQRLLADERELSAVMRDQIREAEERARAAEAKASRLTAALAAIESAPFWKRGAMAKAALALPAPGESSN